MHGEVIWAEALAKETGIEQVRRLLPGHAGQILEIEADAEKRSLMGLGKVVNTGIHEVLTRDPVYVGLTSMDFDWGNHASLVLKKGSQIVGEEIRDQEKIDRLSGQKNVWFMHANFVVYRDRIEFPRDIMKKNCHFETPCIVRAFLKGPCPALVRFANPSTPCDVFLKENYFMGVDERGTGTVLAAFETASPSDFARYLSQ